MLVRFLALTNAPFLKQCVAPCGTAICSDVVAFELAGRELYAILVDVMAAFEPNNTRKPKKTRTGRRLICPYTQVWDITPTEGRFRF
jgi:hypothetical protein